MADEKQKSYLATQVGNLVVWVNSHGGPTKVGAACILLAGIAYGAVPQFHDFCVSIWMHIPTKVKTLCVTGFTLYSWLRNPATRKIFDGLLGPGDSARIKDPVLSTDGTLSGSSATINKADTK
jgi:hypothetical protein